MLNTHLKLILFLVIFSFSQLLFAGPQSGTSSSRYYTEAPDNSIVKRGIEYEKSQRVLEGYHNSKNTKYSKENIKTLTKEDFTDLNNLSNKSIEKARQEILAGNVVVVDSVVGNATRLGNPDGGKGAVILGQQISFLEAKIIRLAVESHAVGAMIPQVLWCSEENLDATTKIVKRLDRKILSIDGLDPEIKTAVRRYVRGNNITLMTKSELTPVVGEDELLTTDRMRNLGAGELVPTLYDSGVAEKLGFNKNTKVVFSNVDFDVDYLKIIAGSIEAGNPDLMQVHVMLQAVGGSAYKVKVNGKWQIIPLEWMEVPEEILDKVKSHNTNSMVLQGKALDPELYKELPIPFEKKLYNGKVYYLPKVSLADIGKHPAIRTAIAKGEVDDWFFTGSKNTALLTEKGQTEILKRFTAWEKKMKVKTSVDDCLSIIKNFL